jgi:dienelactone hydrolase
LGEPTGKEKALNKCISIILAAQLEKLAHKKGAYTMSRTGYQHLVHDYYIERLRAISSQRRERLSNIRTRTQALHYQKQTRLAIRRAFSPRPARSPLNARITGEISCRHHRIEKILFESRPGCLVTAHLYLPKKMSGPFPAIIGTCGHDADGIQANLYQEFCQRLARAGFAVLIYDPFNQGERDQYWHLEDKSAVASCTHAHNMMGKQLELVGEFFGMWRAWDGVRALDYLLTRPEIDPTRIGLTGNSGGGTVTTWLWAIEERITMAAPSCFVTTFLHNLENELPADSEQYPPGILGAGLDMADFIIARAPEPALLLGQHFDFFDRRGLREAFADVEYFYDVLGAPTANRDLFIGPQGHGFSRHNQEAMVAFFALHAGLAKPTTIKKPRHLQTDDLNVTERGNTIEAGATPIYEWISHRTTELTDKRKKLGTAELKKRLNSLLHLPKRLGSPHYRVLRPLGLEGSTYARYAIESEHNVRALLRKRLADPAHGHTLDIERELKLYLPHISAEEELLQLDKGQAPLYGLDPRGLGELQPEDADFFAPYGMDYMFHGHALLLGESYIGRRVYDTLSTLDLLVAEGAKKIHLHGRGQGALIALFATLLHDGVGHITLENAPLSFASWCQTPLVFWPAANFPHGILKHFDLPDLYRIVKKRLTLVQPWGPDMRPLKGRALQRALKEAGLK